MNLSQREIEALLKLYAQDIINFTEINFPMTPLSMAREAHQKIGRLLWSLEETAAERHAAAAEASSKAEGVNP
jgi:hypothetical protein